MAVLGPKIAAPTTSVAQQITNTSRQQQAFDTRLLAQPPSNGFITHLGGAVFAQTNTPFVSFGLWAPDGSGGGPGTLLARTNTIPVVNVMQNYEAPIAWVNPSLNSRSQSALRVTQGQQFWLGIVNYAGGGSGNILVGLQASGFGRAWWRRDSSAGLPLNPFGAFTDAFSTTFLFGFYANFSPATAPIITAQLPANGAALTTLTPTFESSWSDAEESLGDSIATYTLWVFNVATGATVFSQAYTPSATELANHRFSRVYDGPALSADTTYSWAITATDLIGNASVITATRTFSIPSTAVVDSTGGTPTGKADGDSSQISFAAHWWHTSNLGATAVQVRILNAAQNQTVKEGPETAKTIAAASSSPGTAFTVSPTEAGIGALPYGQTFYWQIRARASNGQLSAYSTPVVFNTNAIPSTPILISPADNAFSTSLPALVIASTDADADDVPLTGVVFDYEITQLLTGQIRTAVAGSYNSAAGQATFQTTVTQVPAEGPYSWRARARDVSAGTVGITPYSAPRTFNFGAGPVVTVTSPASNGSVGTATPRLTWTSDDVQTAFQVQLYALLAGNVRGPLLHSTPKVLSANLFYDLPAGILQNGGFYQLVISSWDDGDFQGTSAPVNFGATFLVLVALTNVAAQVVAVAGDVEPTTPQLTWNPTTYPTVPSAQGQFTAYVVKRWDVALGRSASEVTLIEITNAAQTVFFDYHAPPGRSLQYAVLQRVTRADGGVVDSPEVLLTPLTVMITTPVIANVGDPGTLRFPVMWLATNLTMGKKRRRSTYQTWGAGGVPSVAEAPGAQNLRDFSFTIMADQYGSLYSHLDAIEAVMDAAGPVCFRDSRRRFFMSISAFSAKRGSSVGKMDISVSCEQVSYSEGT